MRQCDLFKTEDIADKAIEVLSGFDREAFIAYKEFGLNAAAEILGVSPNRIRAVAKRAKRLLDFNGTAFAEPRPCDGCPHYDKCAEEKMACRAFFLWASLKPHAGAPRIPMRDWYDVIFCGGEGDE